PRAHRAPPGNDVTSVESVSAGRGNIQQHFSMGTLDAAEMLFHETGSPRRTSCRPRNCGVPFRDKVSPVMPSGRDLLVETAWLAEHLDDPGVRVPACTVYLHPADVPGGYRIESGRARWAQGHIPGAGFADLHEELSDRTSRLRFMMPSAAQFAEAMGRYGVGQGVRVVLYDRFVNMWAARVLTSTAS